MRKSLKEVGFDFRIKVGYTAAFILLLISYLLTLYGNGQMRKQSGWIKDTNKVISNLEGLASGMKDAETGIRGYTTTKDTGFLEPYKNSFAIVDANLTALIADLKDNDSMQKKLAKLTSLIAARYDRLSFVHDYLPQNKFVINDTLLQSIYKGKILMDSIRSFVGYLEAQEQNLLDVRTKELATQYIALNVITITSLVLALIFALVGFYAYRKEYRTRLLADKRGDVADIRGDVADKRGDVADKRGDDYLEQLQQRIKELDTANKELVLMKRSERFAATGRIARTIAHEVRNPLTNIDLAMAQIKSDMPVEDENSNMLFDMVSRNSQRINQLITELLSATRFAELRFISVCIDTLLDEALEMAKDRIDLNRISIEKKYGMGICNISVDREKIKIAFLNLIVNAIEAMEPGNGVLKIITKEVEGKCVVEMKDNGYGMTEEQLNNLFEPYFTTKSKGNGLGLTNTQNIILNHKGSINVISKPGEGTSFFIKFDFVNPV